MSTAHLEIEKEERERKKRRMEKVIDIANLEAYPVLKNWAGTMRSLYIYAKNVEMATSLSWREPPRKKSCFTKSEKQSPSDVT